MTLEQDIKSEEKCNLRPAKAGHSSVVCGRGTTMKVMGGIRCNLPAYHR